MGLDRQKLSYLKFGDVIKIKKKSSKRRGLCKISTPTSNPINNNNNNNNNYR